MRLRPISVTGAVGVLAAALLTVPATPASAVPGDLQVIPALKQWTAGTGSYTFGTTTRIVVDPAYTAQLNDDAATFAADLRDLTGRTVPVTTGTAATGDIRLTLGGSQPAEGYTMTVGSSIAIQGSTDAGAFYGTRTVLQLLKQSSTVPAGTTSDAPTKSERGMMVDVGRKYFTVDWLRRHVKELAYLKMNRLHLHLSDTFGFRLESTTHPEVVSEQFYTKQQIRDLIALAAQYHIEVIPEIDMPGHMNAILADHPDLQLTDTNGNRNPYYLDLSKPGAYTLARDLITEFLPLFPGRYWHIGADEYIGNYAAYPQLLTYARATYGANATAKDAYYGFINWANDIVRAGGKTTRMWNDGIGTDGTIRPASNIHVEVWYNYGITPQALLDRGHTISNQAWDPTYYVPAISKPNVTWAYETWTPDRFQGNTTVGDTSRNLGTVLHIWCDYPDAETEDQIAAGIRTILRVIAQQTWGSPKPVATYTAFGAIIDRIGRAPGGPAVATGNLATNRPVTASSTETASFPASAAVDGDISTRWSSAYTDPSWIQVDLGSSQELSRVALRWEAAYARAYQIQTSTNGTTWSTAVTVTAGDGGTDEHLVNTTARYVRMQGTARATTFGYSLWEFEVYGPKKGVITGAASGRCVDIPGSNTTDGTAVNLWDCNSGANQTWAHRNDGTLTALGKCLWPANGSITDGTTIVIGTCTTATTQRWTYDTATSTYRTGGKCLDANGGATANGTRLILWPCTNGANQRWSTPTA
ncbi:family 20 glycosylhydrolase [Micromonospora zamorensis]|uniref:family 20 glycosylhydrolase n=1 Tax=Micromonospora zamorensis TaxID=709883 RepID=UPI00386ACD1B|nr:family 20 glycosylhydrolase [Micromonospora zamorensis]